MDLNPLLELARDIVVRVPLGILPVSISGALFWVVMALVWVQYRRLAALERQIHGFVLNDPVRNTATAAAYGVAAGVIGSLLLVFMGVVLLQQDIIYLWPAALLLMFVNPRFLCFSYAAGLLAVSHLLLGFPADLNVAGIMALVAILHLMEGLLVLLSGDGVSTAVYVRREGRVIGGHLIQRFWPIPIMIIFFLQVSPDLAANSVQMPEWWPLIQVAPPTGEQWVRVLTPVVAALGYSDIAVSEAPQMRARKSAHQLWIFSSILLLLSLGVAHWRPLIWVAALFSPLGHEAMIMYGSRKQMNDSPRYLPVDYGVTVMDVKPRGLGARLGLRAEDVIVSVNGGRVSSREDLAETVHENRGSLEITIIRDGRAHFLRGSRDRSGDLEIITVPEPGDREQVDLARSGLLVRWWRRIKARLSRSGRS